MCKAVCKKWYRLISGQDFIKSHFTLSSRTNNINYAHHILIYNTYASGNDLYSCPLYDVLFRKSVNNAIQLENPLQQLYNQTVRIVGSCNGLVCLLAENDDKLFICNPSTRATNRLPPSEQGAVSFWAPYAFGYDDTTNDYKVVKICRCDQPSPYWDTMIYSLIAGSWKEIGRFPCLDPLSDGKFLNGALHWVTGDDCSDSLHIVSLDLGKETYGEVLQPEYDRKGSKQLTLGVLGESLCVLCNYYENCVVDVWVMKDYGVKDSWTKLASIPHPTTWRMYLDILGFLKDGKVLLRFGRQLLVHHSKDSSSLEIVNLDEIDEACVVVESLVSPFPPLALADENEN